MQITVNEIVIPDLPTITVQIAVDPNGESNKPTHVIVTGGRLDIYPSRLTSEGNIKVHRFGNTGTAYDICSAAYFLACVLDDQKDKLTPEATQKINENLNSILNIFHEIKAQLIPVE